MHYAGEPHRAVVDVRERVPWSRFIRAALWSPICSECPGRSLSLRSAIRSCVTVHPRRTNAGDRKSTRLNSSHANISYAVFCLKKKKKHNSENILQKHNT